MLTYWIFRAFVGLFRLIPFSILYRISDVVNFILMDLLAYRKKVVTSNMKRCFPNWSDTELKHHIKSSYKNLTDVLLEGVKGLSMNEDQVRQRYIPVNMDSFEKYLASGQSLMVAAAHITNWEWGAMASGYLYPGKVCGIYKEISNTRINDAVKEIRGACGIQLIGTKNTRFIREMMTENKFFLFASDQSPSNTKTAFWVNFFGQDTPCLNGLEKYSREFSTPVFYADVERISRGKYTFTFQLMCERPQELNPGELTQMYMSRLEAVIRRNPAWWLWTHKRWKHQRTA